jgi:arylsulfatase A-like enzyme
MTGPCQSSAIASVSRRSLLAAAGAPFLRAVQFPARRPPNILFLFADDLGWKDVGYQGTDFYATPNIDRLATQGMVFRQAYASAANCAPSRACLLSGQYTPRHGVYAVQSTLRGPKQKMRMIPIPNDETLAPEKITMAEALKATGYTTGHFGKWHLGNRGGCEPTAQGFDDSFDPRSPDPNRRRDMPDDPKGIYSLTRAAGDFIEKNQNRPWFAYIAHHAIHTALEARPKTRDHFQNKPKGHQHSDPLYAACLYDLDDGIGTLLARLEKLGLSDNTLLVFTSDNGGTQQSSQEPLRGSKGCYYEGGIREPMIVLWPSVTRPGSTCDVPVSNIDLYPTFLHAAAAKPPAGYPLDGESIVPLLRGGARLERQSIFWHFPGYLDAPVPRGRDPVFRTRPVSVIRKGDWKLHLYHEEWQLDGGRQKIATNNAVELYNIRDDVGERRNLFLTNTAKRDELLDDLLAWMKSVNAPMPTERNPGYDRHLAITP